MPQASHERAILIECREGFDGEDRDWFIATVAERTAGAGASAAGPEILGVVGAGAEVEAAFRAYFEACIQRSEDACDLAVALGITRAWELSRWARSSHLFVPNAQLTRALVVSVIGKAERLVDFESSTQQPVQGEILGRATGRVTWSGDGTRLAFGHDPGRNDPLEQRLVVYDVEQRRVLHDIAVGRWLDDIAWSPDGSQLALMCHRSRWGRGPLERLGAAVGHPVPYADFELVVVDLATETFRSMPVAEDVQYGKGLLLWDPRAVRSMVGETRGR